MRPVLRAPRAEEILVDGPDVFVVDGYLWIFCNEVTLGVWEYVVVPWREGDGGRFEEAARDRAPMTLAMGRPYAIVRVGKDFTVRSTGKRYSEEILPDAW